nr:MAG TPA: hypothetical protein [Caudoviricetes sp.]
MDDFITRAEHAEFVKRMEEENKRQNNRISSAENSLEVCKELASSVERLAENMASMKEELANQGTRLQTLEKKPGDRWETVLKTALTTIVSSLAAMIFAAIIANNIIK